MPTTTTTTTATTQMLALRGGAPVRTEPFPSWPVFDEREEQALLRVLRSGKWWQFAYGDGVALTEPGADRPRAEAHRFEEEFAAAHDCRHGVAAANGTATLEIVLRSLDIGPGDEVIVPAYTFIATATSVLQIGAVPVFVDISNETFNLDPARIEEAITRRTRAIVPVHFGGLAADMDAINEIAKRRGLAVVEDAAHAHGSEWRGRKCGSLGDAGSFSFQASKNMTAGEGGCITTNDDALAARCRSYLWGGREPGRPWYEHHRLGWNYRIAEFQAAVLRVQLQRLAEQTKRRDTNGRYLARSLSETSPRVLRPAALDPRATVVSFHVFVTEYDSAACGGLSRDKFVEALNAEGIPCSGGYAHPLYRNPMFLKKDFWKGGFPCVAPFAEPVNFADYAARCPVSERLCREGVWFTQNMFLGTQKDVDDIVTAVEKVARAHA